MASYYNSKSERPEKLPEDQPSSTLAIIIFLQKSTMEKTTSVRAYSSILTTLGSSVAKKIVKDRL